MSDENQNAETSDNGEQQAPPPRTYSQDELDAAIASKLRGQGKQLKEYERKAARLDELERERAEAAEAEAQRKGEFKELHAKAKAEAASLTEERDKYKSRIESLEGLLAEEVESQVASIEDEKFRKELKKRLKGRSVLDQRDILSLVNAARGSAQPEQQKAPPRSQGGAPGRPAGSVPTAKELAENPGLRREAALNVLEDWHAGQAAKVAR